MCFISVYSVLNTISEYKYFYISKNIPSYTLLLVCKIVESLQCMLKRPDAFFLIARGYRGYNVIVRNSFSSKHNYFLIIVSKIIWFWSLLTKKLGSITMSLGNTGCQRYFNHGVKIAKPKVLGSIGLATILNSFHQKVDFSERFEKDLTSK